MTPTLGDSHLAIWHLSPVLIQSAKLENRTRDNGQTVQSGWTEAGRRCNARLLTDNELVAEANQSRQSQRQGKEVPDVATSPSLRGICRRAQGVWGLLSRQS